MPEHRSESHEGHTHRHGPGCGHTSVRHEGHVDYLHEGHLHHQGEDRVDEHRIEVSDRNPERCTPERACAHHHGSRQQGVAQEREHGHEMVPHGDHVDHVHEGRLHHHHGDHCDDHGPLEIVERG